VKRTRHVNGRNALAMAAIALTLAGCAALSPAVTTTPYPAADGVQLDLPGTSVKLRDFLVVGTAQGAPAEVIGVVINNGSSPIQISLQADLGSTAQPTQTLVRVEAQSLVRLGPDQAVQMELPQLPVAPGASTTISAATTAGGTASLVVPVLLAQGVYASLTPAPTTAAPSPTATPTSKSKKKKNKSASPTDSPTTEPTPTATNS
jgi:hypothetical protein